MKKLILILFLFIVNVAYSQNYDTKGNMEVNSKLTIVYELSDTNTVSTNIDTVSRYIGSTLNNFDTKFTNWFQFIAVPTDTVWISTDINFANKKMILPDESVTTFKYDMDFFDNIYMKVYGTGTALVRYWIGGN